MFRGMQNFDSVNWSQPVNWSHPLNRGLSGWWLTIPNRCGWRSFAWRDLAFGRLGTLTNMEQADWQFTSRTGGYGHLSFGGTDEYVATGLSMASLTKFTIAAWLRRNASGSLVYLGSNADDVLVQIGFFSDGVCYVSPDPAGANFMTFSSNVTTPLHMIYSFDGSGGTAAARNRVWINGAEVALSGSVAATTTNASAGTLDIGRRQWLGTYSTGDIDDVRVYRSRAIGHEGFSTRLYRHTLNGNRELFSRVVTHRRASEQAAAGGLSIPIAAYHYNHHLHSMC